MQAEIVEREASRFNLVDYKKLELNSVTDLRRLRDISDEMRLEPATIRLIDEVLQRIQQGRFSVAVVGEFKRGKSTFINALLGKDILPSDVMPCSATLNRVTYGFTPSVQIVFKGENGQPGRTETIGIDQLSDYVTKLTPESEERASQIREAVVSYPLEYLRNNVDIIDTPGLNDDAGMTAVTLSVIPQVDAAILVIMPEAPFAGSEGDFLNDHLLLQDLGRVIFVVTAIDRLRTDQDRDRIVKAIKERIKKSVEGRLSEHLAEGSEEYKLYRKQIGAPKVFALSAWQALQAKADDDQEALEKSRFPWFEASLERFLTETRGAVELKVLANRTVAASDEILKKIHLETGALTMNRSQFDEAYAAATRELEALRGKRREESGKIDAACEQTRQRVRPLILQMEDDLKKAAEQAVDEAPITPADLRKSKQEALLEKLARRISESISTASKRGGERLQIEIDRDLRAELDRLQTFASAVGQTLYDIEVRFAPVDASAAESRNVQGEGVAAVISGLTGFGGIWSGYREAGLKGAAIGAVTSFATVYGVGAGVGVALAILGAPLTLPILLGTAVVGGVASIFTGRWVNQSIFGEERVERFRAGYKESALKQVAQSIEAERLDLKIDVHVKEAFGGLKEKVFAEVDARVEQTQSTLDELRRKKACDETLSDHRREELGRLVVEVEGVRGRALRLADQLTEITEI